MPDTIQPGEYSMGSGTDGALYNMFEGNRQVCNVWWNDANRNGKYKILALCGMAVGAFGMYLFSLLTPTSTQTELVIKMVITGMGIGVSFPIFNIIVQNTFSHEYLGVATASVQLFRNIGGTVGTALLGGLFNYGLQTQHLDFSSALSHVYLVTTAVLALGFVAVACIPELSLRKTIKPAFLEEVGIEIGEEYGDLLPE